VVDVAIFGDYNDVFSIPVTSEGSLVVPSIGIVRVLGLSLDGAEDRVRALVGRFYRNVEVRLALSRVRTFKVFVVGDVPEPGMREASAATRVSEVLGGTVGLSGPQPPGGPVIRRNVTLRRTGGQELRLDLRRFLQTGDVASNPTLREGDAVIVPAVDERVDVFGRVHYPGRYEFREGETLAQLLEVANGGAGFPSNAADTVRVARFANGGGRTVHLFTNAQAVGPEGQRFVLQPFDAVYLPELGNYKRQHTAAVTGAVARPGVYPIRQDTTTVRELVQMAGGFAPNASLVEATLRRTQPAQASTSRSTLENVPPELLSEDERRLLQVRAQGDAGTVVVDFENLFQAGGRALDVPLRSGDVLNVPESRNQVTVLGAVRTPGILPYQPGQTVSYYVALAGGYGRTADAGDVRVLKARQGTPVHWRDVQELEAGDTVIVPFRERRDWVQTLQSVQAVVGTLSGILLAIIAVRQL
jgi:protein involved in polysaccharide export with SLBB domain